MRFAFLAALCLSLLPAQNKPAPKPAGGFDKPAFEAYVRHLLAVIPEVQIKVDDPKASEVPSLKQVDVHFIYGERSQDETFFVDTASKKVLRGTVYDLTQNPFKADLDKLKIDGAPNFGTPGAPVSIVSFSDFECPNCKEEALGIRQNLEKAFPGQVRFTFMDFPLESIHPWAKSASIAGRCFFRQSPSAFWQYHDWMFEHQGEITADNLKTKVQEFAKEAKSVDGMQLGRCMDSKATEADVNATIAQGKALHIDATPTLFVNGRRLVGNYPWQNLQQIISGELNYQKTAHDTAEKCCEIKIPSPLNK